MRFHRQTVLLFGALLVASSAHAQMNLPPNQTILVSGTHNGGTWTGSGNTLSINGGVFHTNTGTFTFQPTAEVNYGGGGSWVNSGTWIHDSAFHLRVSEPEIMYNRGTFEFRNDGGINLAQNPESAEPWAFFNYGTIRKVSGNESAIISLGANHHKHFESRSGTIEIAADKSLLILGSKQGPGSLITNTTLNIGSNATLRLSGYWRSIAGPMTGAGQVKVVAAGGFPTVIIKANGELGVTGTGLLWGEAGFTVQQNVTVTNTGTFVFRSTAEGGFACDGTFVNTGTFLHDSTNNIRQLGGNGLTLFDNRGLFECRNTGGWYIYGIEWNPYKFYIRESGTLRKTGGGRTLFTEWHNSTWRVYGTVEVLDGELDLDLDSFKNGTSDVSQFYDDVNGRLLAGTWKVSDPDGTNSEAASTLSLDLGGTADGKVYTIETNASVVLSGRDSNFARVEDHLATVNGTLGVHNGRKFLPVGNLHVAGALEFGLGKVDTIDPALTTNAVLVSPNTVTLATNSVINVVDIGGFSAGKYILVSCPGALVDNGVKCGPVPETFNGRMSLDIKTGVNGYVILRVRHAATVVTVF